MLGPLITGLTSLRDFLSRSFLIGAFLPTLLFNTTNVLILFVWNWPFHNWARREILDSALFDKTVVCALLFLFVWLQSYIVSALTPLWTRSLEGKNWPEKLRNEGIREHRKLFDSAQEQINACVEIYTAIDEKREKFGDEIAAAFQQSSKPVSRPTGLIDVRTDMSMLQRIQRSGRLIKFEQLQTLVKAFLDDLKYVDTWTNREKISQDITLIFDYAYKKALQEHFRRDAELSMGFGSGEEIEPTEFGNVGKSASAYCSRAFKCNLSLIWDPLRRAISKEAESATNLDNCKAQMDFFVASFWLSLFQAVFWAIVFAAAGEVLGAISAAIVGPAICLLLWYGAAVGQYQALQSLVIAALNSPLRHQVLVDLHLGLPANLVEERELWDSINQALGFGRDIPVRYQFQKQ